MKNPSRLFLFGSLILLLLSSACGAPATATPTAMQPTTVPVESDTPVVGETETPTETPVETMVGMTETPTPGGSTVTPVPVTVNLVCWFCVQQVPFAVLLVSQGATVQGVGDSSGITCSGDEVVGDMTVMMCRGPEASGMINFDLNVCDSDGNCTERQVTTIDCSATPMPMMTVTSTVTVTPTVTRTLTAGAVTGTATTAASAPTGTLTPAAVTTSTATAPALTATPTP